MILGWVIDPREREAARASIQWVLATFDVDQIIHSIDCENAASQAIARQLGAEVQNEMQFAGACCRRLGDQPQRMARPELPARQLRLRSGGLARSVGRRHVRPLMAGRYRSAAGEAGTLIQGPAPKAGVPTSTRSALCGPTSSGRRLSPNSGLSSYEYP